VHVSLEELQSLGLAGGLAFNAERFKKLQVERFKAQLEREPMTQERAHRILKGKRN